MHRFANRVFAVALALAAVVSFLAGMADARLAANHNQTFLRP